MCTLAIWHAPRYSSGVHGNYKGVAPFWEALYAAGADVVVNGHDHDYERFAPQDPDGNEDRARGIREFVVGTGGAELRPFTDARPNSELRAAVTHGVLKLEAAPPRSYDWTFIPTGWTTSPTPARGRATEVHTHPQSRGGLGAGPARTRACSRSRAVGRSAPRHTPRSRRRAC